MENNNKKRIMYLSIIALVQCCQIGEVRGMGHQAHQFIKKGFSVTKNLADDVAKGGAKVADDATKIAAEKASLLKEALNKAKETLSTSKTLVKETKTSAHKSLDDLHIALKKQEKLLEKQKNTTDVNKLTEINKEVNDINKVVTDARTKVQETGTAFENAQKTFTSQEKVVADAKIAYNDTGRLAGAKKKVKGWYNSGKDVFNKHIGNRVTGWKNASKKYISETSPVKYISTKWNAKKVAREEFSNLLKKTDFFKGYTLPNVAYKKVLNRILKSQVEADLKLVERFKTGKHTSDDLEFLRRAVFEQKGWMDAVEANIPGAIKNNPWKTTLGVMGMVYAIDRGVKASYASGETPKFEGTKEPEAKDQTGVEKTPEQQVKSDKMSKGLLAFIIGSGIAAVGGLTAWAKGWFNKGQKHEEKKEQQQKQHNKQYSYNL